jgi:hypothetical protein
VRMKSLVIMLAIALAAFLCPQPAHATLELKLDDGAGHAVDILDGGAGDSCANANCITWIGSLGVWSINVSTGLDKNMTGDLIHLNSVDTATAAGNMTITLSDNGFTPGNVGGFTAAFGPLFGSGGTGSYSAYEDDTTKFALTHQIGSTLTAAGSTSGGPASSPSGYALTQVVTLHFGNGGGTSSFDASINPVPEPAGVTLLGGVLLFSAAALRRRLQRG